MVSYTEPKKVGLGLVISEGGFKTAVFYLCMLIHNGPLYPVILFRINRGFTNFSFVHGVFLIGNNAEYFLGAIPLVLFNFRARGYLN